MHMGGYAVDPAELQQVDDLLESTVTHARTELAALGSDVRSLLDAGWRSPAAAAFAAGWHDWLAGATELLAALAELGQAVGRSGRGYATTEESVRSSMVAS
jgi:WXG100 family type VII secretion target